MNWNIPQQVTVTVVDDEINDGPQSYTIIINQALSSDDNYNELNPDDVSVINRNLLEATLSVEPGIMKMISFAHWPRDDSAISVFDDLVRENYQYEALFKIGTYAPIPHRNLWVFWKWVKVIPQQKRNSSAIALTL